MSIREQRQIIRRMLDNTSVIDAPTAYYALYHDPKRSTLATRVGKDGRPLGFAGRFQTGYDLFRPLVTMRCRSAEVAADLLAEILTPGRPYIFFANLNQLPLVGGSFQIENQRILHIYYLNNPRFKAPVNVMVIERPTEDGKPRFEIRSGGLQAVSGINWISPGFAELYVHTEPLARKRGWGRSVAAACTAHILRDGRLPLYLAETDNTASIRLAQSLGYVDSGARQLYAEVIYLGHPAPQRPPLESQEASGRKQETR